MTTPKEIRDNPAHEEVMPGVWANVSNAVYHADLAYSRTGISVMAKSPIQYEHSRMYPEDFGDPVLLGSVTHALELEPDTIGTEYLVGPVDDRRTKAWKAFVKEHPDQTIVPPKMMKKARAMSTALEYNPKIAEFLTAKNNLREVSVWATHKATNLPLRARADLIVDGWICDIKTTGGSVLPTGFTSSCYKWDYHLQSAFYQDVFRMAGLLIKGFIFLVVSSNAPFLTAVYTLNEDMENEGRCKYEWALHRWAKYQTTDAKDRWGGLPLGREVVTL